MNLTWMIKDDNLSQKHSSVFSRVVFCVRCNHPSLYIFRRKTLYIESHIVARCCLLEHLVVHFHSFYLRSQVSRSKINNHACFKNSSLNPPNRDSSYTPYLIDVLDG